MKNLLFITVMLLGLMTMANEADSLHHFFGASFSGYSGSGLTYRLRNCDSYSVKIAGYYISGLDKRKSNVTDSRDKTIQYNIGLEYQKNLIRRDYMLFYLSGGTDYYYASEGEPIDDQKVTDNFNLGLGFGVDINVYYNSGFPGIVLFMSLGEKYFIETEKRYSDNIKIRTDQLRGFTLTGSVGLGVEF